MVVTGANRGIGKAYLDTLLKYGAAKIYAGVRDVQQTKKTASSMIPGPWYDERVEPLYLDMREASRIVTAAAVIIMSDSDLRGQLYCTITTGNGRECVLHGHVNSTVCTKALRMELQVQYGEKIHVLSLYP